MLALHASDGIEGVITGRALYDGRLDLAAALGGGGAGMTVRVRVIPCLDVADGRVVKGVNFVDLRDAGDPVEQARAYDAAGADELCFLDITASHEGRGTMLDVVAAHRRGLLHAADRRRRRAHGRGCARAAARRAPTRSRSIRAAVARPEVVAEIAERFGSQCVVASVDARRVGQGAGRSSPMAAAARPGSTRSRTRMRLAELGAGELLVTSMDRDGTRDGYDLALTRTIADAVAVPVVASGGVGTLEHLVEGVTRGPCQRGARRLDLPFRRGQHRRGACGAGGGGDSGAETP